MNKFDANDATFFAEDIIFQIRFLHMNIFVILTMYQIFWNML